MTTKTPLITIHSYLIPISVVFCSLISVFARSQTFTDSVAPLIEASCIDCHDQDTKTRLNFSALNNDLSNADNFRTWVNVYDKASAGVMPPKKKSRPDPQQLEIALSSIKTALLKANITSQKEAGRVRTRRLTRLEYEYSLQDLLSIKTPLKGLLPMENAAGFDTVSENQGISPIHISKYLTAGEHALNAAIRTRRRPRQKSYLIDYRTSPYNKVWFKRGWQDGGGSLKRLSDAIVSFKKTDFIWRTDRNGFVTREPGLYRVTAEIYAYQARSPVTFILYKAIGQLGLPRYLKAFDLMPGQTLKVELEAHLEENEYILPSFMNLKRQKDGRSLFQSNPKTYTGEGIAVKFIEIQGPISKSRLPSNTGSLFEGIELGAREDLEEDISKVVARFAPLAFRRPLKEGELDSIAALAQPALEDGLTFIEAVRLPLRGILTSPQFLFHTSTPGKLDDYSLATRLSYFLWKSLPDEELIQVAKEGRLSQPTILAQQVDRLLDAPKSMRFARDFASQWLGLYNIDATTPDKILYPEYNDLLRQSMIDETEHFFMELIAQNLKANNLIQSDFTFLNRELAEHYDITGVKGQFMRKTLLPKNSIRGGLLAQASILKVTANGTTTSPVRRGNFILTHLLGQATPAPPGDIGSIEPDIRGAVSIKETLAAHTNAESCATCHQHIDPPGFALESFNPIGGHRRRYRTTGRGDWTGDRIYGRHVNEYRWARHVDSGGITADGQKFSGIRKFRDLLLEQEEQVARNFISQLVVYSTGGEIEFADREEIERILSKARPGGFGLRKIIHEVIKSRLFSHQ